jgi:hypothetical protein
MEATRKDPNRQKQPPDWKREEHTGALHGQQAGRDPVKNVYAGESSWSQRHRDDRGKKTSL